MTTDAPILLVLGTRNPKKCREMAELIAPPWEPNPRLARLAIRSLDEFAGAPEVVEDADTFAGNARKKAAEAARALGQWVVADDSGLAVDALDGAPGVFSARYAGEPCDDEANNRKLLEALAALDGRPPRRGVPLRLALADPSGDHPARGRRLVPRPADPRAPGRGRVRLRPALPDPGVSPDVRRAQPARQAPAQPPRPGLRPSPARPRPDDRPGRDRGRRPGSTANRTGNAPGILRFGGVSRSGSAGRFRWSSGSRGDTRFRAACPGVRRPRSGPRARPPAGSDHHRDLHADLDRHLPADRPRHADRLVSRSPGGGPSPGSRSSWVSQTWRQVVYGTLRTHWIVCISQTVSGTILTHGSVTISQIVWQTFLTQGSATIRQVVTGTCFVQTWLDHAAGGHGHLLVAGLVTMRQVVTGTRFDAGLRDHPRDRAGHLLVLRTRGPSG